MDEHPTIRIDISTPAGKKPELVGLCIPGFGWIIGGTRSGDLTLRCDLVNPRPFEENLDEPSLRTKINRFWKRLKGFDWEKECGRNWPVKVRE